MKSVDLLREQADIAYSELQTALEGVTEGQAWAVLPQGGPDYLHTDGSIHGITLHIASCMQMYGSVAFRNTEVRWRDCADQIEKFEPSWQAAMEYVRESQEYWLSCWSDLRDEDLEQMVPHFSGKTWPAWRIVAFTSHHVGYHTGQITMLRHAVPESDLPPPSVAADIRQYCPELPSW